MGPFKVRWNAEMYSKSGALMELTRRKKIKERLAYLPREATIGTVKYSLRIVYNIQKLI